MHYFYCVSLSWFCSFDWLVLWGVKESCRDFLTHCIAQRSSYNNREVSTKTLLLYRLLCSSNYSRNDYISQVLLYTSSKSGSGCQDCAKERQSSLITLPYSNFLNRAVSVHGNTYSYSDSTYTNILTNTTITCKIHGNFEQIPNNHLKGNGCPECSKIANGISSTLSHDTLITQFKRAHGDKYDYSKVKYVNTYEKVEIVCKGHGSFWQNPSSHKSGSGCPKCGHSSAWSYSDWEKAGESSFYFTGYKLYVLECSNETEHFIKVGKSFYDIKIF